MNVQETTYPINKITTDDAKQYQLLIEEDNVESLKKLLKAQRLLKRSSLVQQVRLDSYCKRYVLYRKYTLANQPNAIGTFFELYLLETAIDCQSVKILKYYLPEYLQLKEDDADDLLQETLSIIEAGVDDSNFITRLFNIVLCVIAVCDIPSITHHLLIDKIINTFDWSFSPKLLPKKLSFLFYQKIQQYCSCLIAGYTKEIMVEIHNTHSSEFCINRNPSVIDAMITEFYIDRFQNSALKQHESVAEEKECTTTQLNS